MGYNTLKTIGEIEKSKDKKLSVAISRYTEGDKVVDFVSVQELEFNKDTDRYEYSKKGYTLNVERWAGFMKLMQGVDECLNAPESLQEQTTEHSEPKKPGFMGG